MTGDHILLELPADATYGRIARAAAANLALRRGYSLTEIDDLRLAVDEAVITLLGPDAQELPMSVSFDARATHVEVDLRVSEGAPIPAERAARFAEIAASLVDHYDVDRTIPRVRISKSRAPRDTDG